MKIFSILLLSVKAGTSVVIRLLLVTAALELFMLCEAKNGLLTGASQ